MQKPQSITPQALQRDLTSLELASRRIEAEIKSLKASMEEELRRAAYKRVKIVEAYNANR